MSNCWTRCVLLTFFFAEICGISDIPDFAIQFSFNPHLTNITILQSAVYQCSVTGVKPGDSMSLAWIVNGYSSANMATFKPYIDSVGITPTGIGTLNTTLTIPGNNTALNGTTVECTAVGLVNGAVYSDSDSDTLYIQGKPSIVKLFCSPDDPFKIKCHWTKPPHILGLPDNVQYNISVINVKSGAFLMGPIIVDETEYEVDDLEFGVYNISVAAVIGELQGEIDYIATRKGSIEWTMDLIRKNHSLMANITIMEEDIASVPNKAHLLINSDRNTTVDLDEDNNVNLTDLGRFKGHATLILHFDDTGLQQKHPSKPKPINTFDVNSISINDSNSDGKVCFECIYNSYADKSFGCHVEYECTEETAQDSFDIPETVRCRDNVTSLTYNITVYDMDDKMNPAYYLTTYINGITSMNTTMMSTRAPAIITTSTAIMIAILGFTIIVLLAVIMLMIFSMIKAKKKKLKPPPQIAHI